MYKIIIFCNDNSNLVVIPLYLKYVNGNTLLPYQDEVSILHVS